MHITASSKNSQELLVGKNEVNAAEELIEICLGPARSQSLYLFVKLGLPEILQAGGRDYRDLAASAGVPAGPLYRLLRALATLDAVEENPPGTFALSTLGWPLLDNAPDSVRAHVMLMNEEFFSVWGDAMFSMKTGKGAFEKIFGKPYFEWYREHPEKDAIMRRAMDETQHLVNTAVANTYDFSHVATVCDIGGGRGELLASILQRYPNISGILFELPSGIDAAKEKMSGFSSRCDFVAGDFFEKIPAGADIYLLKLVLHDWDDEQTLQILRNCSSAMEKESRLLIIESLIPDSAEKSVLKVWDLHMLVTIGGRERTLQEFKNLLKNCNLVMTDFQRLPPLFSMIEIRKAS